MIADPLSSFPRPRIMGIVNVTPDSFSDGGKYLYVDAAIAHGVALAEAGAQIIDVGGESTRPGATRVSAEEEQRRILPVIAGLASLSIAVSVDTMNASTAFASAREGAVVINDVSGGMMDGAMAGVVADTGLRFVANHWRGVSASASSPAYTDVLEDVVNELTQRAAALIARGVQEDRIILDPGLGFAKTADDNWRLLSHLTRITSLGFPVLIGASRKKFLAVFSEDDAATSDRDPATATISALAAGSGVWGVRVHNVASTRVALDVWEAVQP